MNSTYSFTTDSVTSLRQLPAFKAVGESGIPLPYSVRNDNALTLSLLVCFAVFVITISRSGKFIVRQAKDFFRSKKDQTDEVHTVDTSFFVFMGLADCLLLAIGSYIYAAAHMARYFVITQHFFIVIIFFFLFLAYFCLKSVVYSFVNNVLFGSKKSLQWSYAFMFIITLEAIFVFPLILLLVFFELSVQKALFYFCFILILNKLLTFYKSWSIFFRQSHRSLQNFLYFCALEAAPLLALAGIWLALVNSLKVNF